jgi:hypothetical protein
VTKDHPLKIINEYTSHFTLAAILYDKIRLMPRRLHKACYENRQTNAINAHENEAGQRT